MKIKLISLLICLIASVSFGQKTFVIDDFSKEFYAKVTFHCSVGECLLSEVTILNRVSNKKMFTVRPLATDPFIFNDISKLKSSPKDSFYGFCELVWYDDFNFDGRKDFAIQDGMNSCYGTSSYQIFLASKNGFADSKLFTDLAQMYCGMFNYDPKTKNISVMQKSGATRHFYDDYKVINGLPILVKSVEENDDGGFWQRIEETYKNGKKSVVYRVDISSYLESNRSLLTFFTGNENKLIGIADAGKYGVEYRCIDKDGIIELEYPQSEKKKLFTYRESGSRAELSFQNYSSHYTVYHDTISKKAGVIIKTGGKAYDLKAKPGTIRGDLFWAKDYDINDEENARNIIVK